MATSVDGTRIAWYRYGYGRPRAILFIPTWNLVDARVVGHQVAALEPHATVVTYDPRGAGASSRQAERGYGFPDHAADAAGRAWAANGHGAGDDRHRVARLERGGPPRHRSAASSRAHRRPRAVHAPSNRIPQPPDPVKLDDVGADWSGFTVPLHARRLHRAGLRRGHRGDDRDRHGRIARCRRGPRSSSSTDRSRRAPRRASTCPTLVVHGEADAGGVPLSPRRDIVQAPLAERAARRHPRRRSSPRHPQPGARQPVSARVCRDGVVTGSTAARQWRRRTGGGTRSVRRDRPVREPGAPRRSGRRRTRWRQRRCRCSGLSLKQQTSRASSPATRARSRSAGSISRGSISLGIGDGGSLAFYATDEAGVRSALNDAGIAFREVADGAGPDRGQARRHGRRGQAARRRRVNIELIAPTGIGGQGHHRLRCRQSGCGHGRSGELVATTSRATAGSTT